MSEKMDLQLMLKSSLKHSCGRALGRFLTTRWLSHFIKPPTSVLSSFYFQWVIYYTTARAKPLMPREYCYSYFTCSMEEQNYLFVDINWFKNISID